MDRNDDNPIIIKYYLKYEWSNMSTCLLGLVDPTWLLQGYEYDKEELSSGNGVSIVSVFHKTQMYVVNWMKSPIQSFLRLR